MKKILFLFVLACVMVSAPAQKKEKIKGNREVVTKLYTLKPFHAIALGEDLRVVLKQAADEEALELRADENLHEVLQWEVTGGILQLHTSKEIVSKRKFEIAVYTEKDLRLIRLSGSAKIETDGKLPLESLTLETSEAAKAELAVKIKDTLTVRATGKSRIHLDADAALFRITLTDNAKLKGTFTGKELVLNADKSAGAHMGGGVKRGEFTLKDKSEADALRLIVKKEAVVDMRGKTGASLQGQGARLEMRLTDKAQLHVAGNFSEYRLKKFEGNSALTREP